MSPNLQEYASSDTRTRCQFRPFCAISSLRAGKHELSSSHDDVKAEQTAPEGFKTWTPGPQVRDRIFAHPIRERADVLPVLRGIGFVARSVRRFSGAAIFTLFFTETNEASKAPLTGARLSKGQGGKSGERWDEAGKPSVCLDHLS